MPTNRSSRNWPKADHFERIVEVDCTVEDARALLDLAKQLYPVVVPDIEKLSLHRAIRRFLPQRIERRTDADLDDSMGCSQAGPGDPLLTALWQRRITLSLIS